MDRDRMLALLKERNLLVASHDPVLEVAAIFEIVAEDAAARMESAVKAQADRITAAGVQQVAAAREIAGEAGRRAGEEVTRRLREGADETTRNLLRFVEERIERVERASRASIYAAWIAAGAAVVALAVLTAVALRLG